MDSKVFFDQIRSSLFGSRLKQEQVQGINAILDSCRRNNVEDERHVANILAQVFHETGTYMLPIKETVMPWHQDKNPSDATVIARLNRAFENGQLPWVKTVYWRDGWFGRGPIQITHEDNYRRMGLKLGVDLVGDRSKALDPKVGADIAVVGMRDGMFTGKSLRDYFNESLNDPEGARRIVNGPDGTDKKIAGYHKAFLDALKASSWKPGEVVDEHQAEYHDDSINLIPSVAVGVAVAIITATLAWMFL
jgi:predicted chitinase